MSFKYIPPSTLRKRSIKYLEDRLTRLNKSLHKTRIKDRKKKGTSYYSAKWKNMLSEHENTTKELLKKLTRKRKRKKKGNKYLSLNDL